MHGEYSWSSLGGRTYRAAYIYLDLGYHTWDFFGWDLGFLLFCLAELFACDHSCFSYLLSYVYEFMWHYFEHITYYMGW